MSWIPKEWFQAQGGSVTAEAIETALGFEPCPTPHGHETFAEVAGLQAALDSKQAAGSYAAAGHNHDASYAPISHSHSIANVTGLQAALDGKQVAGSYAAASHNHDASYAATGHTHGNASQSVAGFMSAADKTKLDGVGGDAWTRVGLASDFTNNTVTFNTITGFSYTPPANNNFVIECELLLQTTATATLPRIGVNVGAGQSYGSVEMSYQATATGNVFANGQFTTSQVNVQMPAGTAPATTPYSAYVLVKGRSGASPGAIAIQLASETAATTVTVKAGSEFRRRTI